MELRQVRYFLAVAEEGNFTKAAQRLYVAQSTLSEQVRTLERSLGVPLFERNSRHVGLTAHGERLIGPARRLLATAEEAVLAARSTEDTPDRTIRIGVLCDAPPPRFHDLLQALTKQRPRLIPQLVDIPVRDYPAELNKGTVDVVVVAPADDDFSCTPLDTEPIAVSMPWDHPLASATEVGIEDVLQAQMVRPDPGLPTSYRRFWWLENHRQGQPERYVGEPMTTVLGGYQSVLFDGAIMLSPACVAEAHTSGGLITNRPLHGMTACEVVIASRPGDDRPEITQLLTVIRLANGSINRDDPSAGTNQSIV